MTALKLVGAALLVTAGALLGNARAAALRRQLALLRELGASLGLLADELTALQTPLPRVFERLRRRPFFDLLHAGFGAEPTEQLWRRAAEVQDLPPAEREALASLAPVVGRYDAERQAAEIALVRRRLADGANALEAELRGRAKTFTALGAALGAAAAVILF